MRRLLRSNFAALALIFCALPAYAGMTVPGVAETDGTFTPADQSGAGLSFTGANGFYHKIGRNVTVWGFLTFPTTASAVQVNLGPLPFTASNSGTNLQPSIAVFGCGAAAVTGLVNKNSTNLVFGGSTTGAAVNNVACTGSGVYFSGTYTADQ